MTDTDAVLAANLEFYRAFTMRDIEAMDAVWARHAPIACLHPGWTALTDRDAVMSSWGGILSNPDAPRVTCFDERVLLFGDTALVLCEEELDGGAPSLPAISSSVKTAFGGSPITMLVRS